VIVPDGVLFGSSRAHVEVRRRIIEENRLDGVVSMPSGVFKPYAGVSTAVLFFTRGAQTKDTPAPHGFGGVWFYDMAHDGFSLDDKRVAIDENDIPDVIQCWTNRFDADFGAARTKRISDLRRQLTPLKTEALTLHAEINRLMFESVVSPSSLTLLPVGEGRVRANSPPRKRDYLNSNLKSLPLNERKCADMNKPKKDDDNEELRKLAEELSQELTKSLVQASRDIASSIAQSASQLSASQVSASQRSASQVSASQVSASQVTASQRSASQVTASQRSANQVSASQVSASQVTASQQSASLVSADLKSANQVSASNVSASNISARQIPADIWAKLPKAKHPQDKDENNNK
jgi:hypothetical protein